MYQSIAVQLLLDQYRYFEYYFPDWAFDEMYLSIQNFCSTLLEHEKDDFDIASIAEQYFLNRPIHIFIISADCPLHFTQAMAAHLYERYGLVSIVDKWLWREMETLNISLDIEKSHILVAAVLESLMDMSECVLIPSILGYERRASCSTNSAWAYYEMVLSEVLRRKCPARIMEHAITENYGQDSKMLHFEVVYDTRNELDACRNILPKAWDNWEEQCRRMRDSSPRIYNPTQALDEMYRMAAV